MEKKRRIVWTLAVVAVVLLVGFVHVWLPVSQATQQRAVALLNVRRDVVLPLPEGRELLLQTDSTWQTGFFTDPRGELRTAPLDTALMDTAEVNRRLREQDEQLHARRDYLEHQVEEITYYQHTHSARDDGYQEVMSLLGRVQQALAEADSLLTLTQLAGESSFGLPEVRWDVTVRYRSPGRKELTAWEASVTDAARGVCQLDSVCLPSGATFFNTTVLRLPSWKRWTLGYLCFWTATMDSLQVERVARTDSLPPMAVGSPVVDRLGHVRGVVTAEGVAPVGGWAVAPRLWWACLRQWWTRLFASDNMPKVEDDVVYAAVAERGYLGHLSDSVPDGQGRADGYEGQWKNGKREGEGLFTDSAGTRYVGLWHADTLTRGYRIQGDTVYVGDFNALMQPDGEGEWTCRTGYYGGGFRDGLREGFGISLSPDHIVRAGSWKADVFKGEHMVYTVDRVYGIDISRYQHEIKRRRYNILWRQLRVTSLGRNGNRRVEGQTNYPVSFCYIKATQGISIRSRYYAIDAAAARRQGIAVGAYHFFSPISGSRQATFFLSVAKPRKGDLPPVLDVELTDRQIAKMGGAAVMRREMLTWLRAVERKTGTKPVLYVSQNFIVKYLHDDARELLDYPVWIARYSEYKPYVRLLFWQLSCDGRVQGITGAVDINVWNGTKEQFQEFRQTSAVR